MVKQQLALPWDWDWIWEHKVEKENILLLNKIVFGKYQQKLVILFLWALKACEGWRCGDVVENLLNVHQALDLIPHTAKKVAYANILKAMCSFESISLRTVLFEFMLVSRTVLKFVNLQEELNTISFPCRDLSYLVVYTKIYMQWKHELELLMTKCRVMSYKLRALLRNSVTEEWLLCRPS